MVSPGAINRTSSEPFWDTYRKKRKEHAAENLREKSIEGVVRPHYDQIVRNFLDENKIVYDPKEDYVGNPRTDMREIMVEAWRDKRTR